MCYSRHSSFRSNIYLLAVKSDFLCVLGEKIVFLNAKINFCSMNYIESAKIVYKLMFVSISFISTIVKKCCCKIKEFQMQHLKKIVYPQSLNIFCLFGWGMGLYVQCSSKSCLKAFNIKIKLNLSNYFALKHIDNIIFII